MRIFASSIVLPTDNRQGYIKMRISTLLITFATLCSAMAVAGCKGGSGGEAPAPFDWDNNSRITYGIDYEVCFAADHDSTMQLTAQGSLGRVAICRLESENLLDADGHRVWNTFIVLEDSIPIGKSITLRPGGLSYTGGMPECLHVQTVGSDDLVELRVAGSEEYTLYSIRDNQFYGPDEQQSFSIPGGSKFSVTLPIMTEEPYPRPKEPHHIQIAFDITECL